jgi:hypothetical protein
LLHFKKKKIVSLEKKNDYEGDNSVLMPTKLEVTNQELDNVLQNTQDLLTGNENPIKVDKTPKHVIIKESKC